MKKKIVLIITLLSIFMIGCTSKTEESSLVEEGKIALEAHKYSDAMKLLSNALDEDSSDEHARSMYMQAMRMINVDSYKSKTNYKKAIEELEAIEKIKNGSQVIKSEASNELKEIKKLYESQKEAERKRKEDAKTAASKDAYKASQQLTKYEESLREEEEKKKQEEEEQLNNNQNTENNENTNEGDNQTQGNTNQPQSTEEAPLVQ
ncbi:MAG: hypothetical protein E7E21_03405 [Peptostreptococcaceae bacterium]|nr:hypothetical protein [Peptostreptococcaceae bacterium]